MSHVIDYKIMRKTEGTGSGRGAKRTTVDADYNRQVKLFVTDTKQLPHLRKQQSQLDVTLSTLMKKDMFKMSNDEIAKCHQLRLEIEAIKKEITHLESLDNVTDFYLRTGALLMDYYDNADTSKSPTTTTPLSVPVPVTVPVTVPVPVPTTTVPVTVRQQNPPPPSKPQAITGKKNNQRADLYEKYLVQTDPHHRSAVVNQENEELKCPTCGINRKIIVSDAIMVCPKCGNESKTIIESDKPSYRDPPHENMYFAYKRINHFKEQLSHFQAKETTKIPQEVYDAILVEFKKEKRTNLANLNKQKVKRYLQKYSHLGYHKYYENINQIICHLNGYKPFYMKPEVEEQLCNMFIKIQEPFDRHCPPGRTNFLSYSYVIYKFCQLLGYYEYLQYFNLHKSKDKLRQHDKIWKKICGDLGWTYYPSGVTTHIKGE